MFSLRSSTIAAVVVGAFGAVASPAFGQPLPTPIPAFTTAQYLNLRMNPGTQNPVVIVMPAHSQVWVYYCLPQPYWCYLSYGQYAGWASATYLVSYPTTPPPQIFAIPQPFPYPAPPPPPQAPGYWTYPAPQDNIQLIPIFGASG
jgi:hypothetical protein